MKKHLIAAAVAGALAVPAMAQVTIKGVFDVQAYGTTSADTQASSAATVVSADTNATAGNNGWSTSEIRFEGSEDLGGGLQASFSLATGLSGGTSTFADRDRFIGLAGGFGSVKMGRFVPAAGAGFNGYTGAGTTNQGGSLYHMNGAATAATQARFGGGFTAGSMERNPNLLQYTTPTMSGVVVNVAYGSVEDDASGTNGSNKGTLTALHLGYSAGPLSVGIGTNKLDIDVEAAAPDSIEGNLTWVGGSYNLGMATVGLAHIQREDETTTSARVATTNADVKINAVGVTVPMGAITLRGSFYDGQNDRSALTTDDLDLSGYQVSLNYALSKRTMVYVAMGESKVERSGATNTGDGALERKTNGIGVSHSF